MRVGTTLSIVHKCCQHYISYFAVTTDSEMAIDLQSEYKASIAFLKDLKQIASTQPQECVLQLQQLYSLNTRFDNQVWMCATLYQSTWCYDRDLDEVVDMFLQSEAAKLLRQILQTLLHTHSSLKGCEVSTNAYAPYTICMDSLHPFTLKFHNVIDAQIAYRFLHRSPYVVDLHLESQIE